MDNTIQEANQRLKDLRKDLQEVTPAQSTTQIMTASTKKSSTTPKTDVCKLHGCAMKSGTFSGTAWTFCPECVAEKEARSLAQESAEESKRLLSLKLANLQIGDRYRHAKFSNYEPFNDRAQEVATVCRQYAESISKRIAGGDSLLLHGSPGTGKNHLASAIAKACVFHGHTALHTTARRIGRAFRRCWDTKQDQDILLGTFIKPDLLIVDEIVKSLNQIDTDTLTEILCERYHSMRPSILLANLDMNDLIEKFGAHVIDRFYDGKSSVLLFDWESHRRL